MIKTVHIIGGGLAGSEAAYQLAKRNIPVIIYEMRPELNTPVHSGDNLAELVCSNSLKAESTDTGSGLLKAELEIMDSLLINIAKKCRVPAGGSLSVDRELFAARVTKELTSMKNITVIRGEIKEIPAERPLIIASGPLTSDTLAEKIKELVGGGLHFFDAIAPIIDFDSINLDKCFFKSRYDKGEPDYLNCPMTKEEYDIFYDALIESEKVEFENFEKINVFEGCMPIEEMASRGRKTLTFGPLKPVGLEHPETGKKFYAVLQLRKENEDGTAYNLVGCQTKMKIGAQKGVFKLIPGLENAEFLRFGSIHRNTYIDAPKHLDDRFRFADNFYFAGQITGVEGYVESIASGLIVGRDLALRMLNEETKPFPRETALGSLGHFVTDKYEPLRKKYVPSNFHFGMLPALSERVKDKKTKKTIMAEKALEALKTFLSSN